jgi:hypothetical protein
MAPASPLLSCDSIAPGTKAFRRLRPRPGSEARYEAKEVYICQSTEASGASLFGSPFGFFDGSKFLNVSGFAKKTEMIPRQELAWPRRAARMT